MDFLGGGLLYNLITLLIALAAVVAGGSGAYFARKALFPSKRKLSCYALAVASLLTDESVTETGIEVKHQGVNLQDPYLVTICLENVGRYAVTSSHFDRSRPLAIDLGVNIKAVTKLSISPSTGSSYEHSTVGSKLLLGPDLLEPGQVLIVQLLTDGVPKIDDLNSHVERHLGDTEMDFKERRATPASNRPSSIVLALGTVSSVLMAVVVAVLAWTLFLGPSVSLIPDNGTPGALITFTGTGAEEFSVVSVDMPVQVGGSNSSDLHEIARTQADESGKFQASFKIPDTQEKGAVQLTIHVHESNQTRFLYATLYVR